MLSIENPPPDPPCPCEIAQLKSSDERASHNLALQDVDLFASSIDDTKLPNFSIRDYVFTARNKDIKTNWPFSQRNLQLCMKHGVKDLLPPFQSLDSLRNRSFIRCPLETRLLEQEPISNSDGEPSEPTDCLAPSSSNVAPCDQKLAVGHTDITSCRSGEVTDFPSTTTSNSQSEIDSVPTSGISSSAIETGTSLEAAVEVEAVGGPPASHKTENTTQPSTKKCRLIVKLSTVSDPCSTEDIASNCTSLSEAMTSKICPVCKTFSSSSNTTLNAHIDQCLSEESPSKWMPDSKLNTKYRVKPRKMRSMVDICETAPRCTLEELDKRNGSSWATDSSLPTQNTEVCALGKKQKVSPVYSEDNGDEGAVYIDANGTKLRILSKFNNGQSVSTVGEEPGPRKPLKGVKRSKFLSNNKKRRHAPKHHKHLKLAPPSKKFCSSNARSSEIHGDQDGVDGVEETRDKQERLMQLFKAQGPIKPSDSGTLRQWVCSKRTGLSKKINAKDGHQISRCKLHLAQDLLVESDRSCLGDSHMEGNRVQEFPNSAENPISSHENRKRMESSLYEAQVSENSKLPPGRKTVRSPLFGARRSDNVERSLEPLKQNSFQLSKDSTSVHDGHVLKHPHDMTNCATLLSDKTVEVRAGPVRNSEWCSQCQHESLQGLSFSLVKSHEILHFREECVVCQSIMCARIQI
ncbi:hypothetical protein L1049_000716 [Liquidambar formosana]|uniref:UBZ4-type domain-containing protein n=1 Tax=Liquidambar formosana TaxID=63359 RepID=A0AAP0R4Z8_LIQFO